jgi:hypothetical protein
MWCHCRPVFAAVYHAKIPALKLGDPFGSIRLAVAGIEVALIISVMVQARGGDSMSHATIFAAVMIVLDRRRSLPCCWRTKAIGANVQLLGVRLRPWKCVAPPAALALLPPHYALTMAFVANSRPWPEIPAFRTISWLTRSIYPGNRACRPFITSAETCSNSSREAPSRA